jgi:hypothetical protein
VIAVVPFQPGDLDTVQGPASASRPRVTAEHAKSLAALPHNYTVLSDGHPIACGGVVEHWPGRWEAWAVLDGVSRKDFLAVHCAAKRILNELTVRRIEAVVRVGYTVGIRWVRALGFQQEAARMKHYGVDGEDYSMYARVQ